MFIVASMLFVATAPPSVDIDISQESLQGLLEAMAPIENSATIRFGGARIKVFLRLSEPKVEVTPEKILISAKYEARDENGLIRLNGVAHPEMEIVKAPNRPRFQGKMKRSGILLPGGIDLPIENFVPPINLPATYSNQFRLRDKTVTANSEVKRVTLVKGKIRLHCDVTFE